MPELRISLVVILGYVSSNPRRSKDIGYLFEVCTLITTMLSWALVSLLANLDPGCFNWDLVIRSLNGKYHTRMFIDNGSNLSR